MFPSFSQKNVCRKIPLFWENLILHHISFFSVVHTRDAPIPILVSGIGPILSSFTRTRTRQKSPIRRTDTTLLTALVWRAHSKGGLSLLLWFYISVNRGRCWAVISELRRTDRANINMWTYFKIREDDRSKADCNLCAAKSRGGKENPSFNPETW